MIPKKHWTMQLQKHEFLCLESCIFSRSSHDFWNKTKKPHRSSQKETTTWNTKLDSGQGNTNQEILQEFNPGLDTEASSFMLHFNKNCSHSQNLILKLHYKIKYLNNI